MGCCNSTEAKPDTAALVQLVRSGKDQDLHRHLQLWSAQELQGVKVLLHEACSALQPGCVGVLLQVGVPCDGRDELFRTPLHVLIVEASKQDGHSDRAAKALGIMRQILKHAHTQGRLPQLDVPDQNYTPLLLSVVSQQDLLTSELLLANFDLAAVTVQEKNNVLHLSVSNVHQLMSLLEAAADRRMNAVLVNEPNADGNTPLHLALIAMRELPLFPTSSGLQMANANPLSVAASMLIERGCFIDMPNRAGQSAVSLAVDCAMRALEAGADTSACTEVLLTIAKGRVAASPDIFNQPGDMGKAAVHVAAQLGHVPLLNSLEARGARMDVQDADGRLPAVLAAQAGNKAALLRMLGHLRADGLCRERTGESAATAVLLNPAFSPEDVHAILRTMIRGWGEQQRLSAQPVLCLACQRGNVDTVKLLVLEGEVDVCGKQGCMPLMATVEAHCKTPSQQLVKIVEFLMEQGANPVAEDNTRATALGMALEGGHLDMAMVMLRAQSVHVDHVAPNGHTALFLAIRGGYTAMARELVTYNACTGPRPGLTYIPLHVAVEKMNVAIVELLLKTEQGRQAVAVRDATNKSVLDYLWASWAAVAPRGPPPPPGKPAAPPTPEVVALLEIAKLLLSHPNCDVNALDTMGMRPMHWAVQLDQPKLVQTLASRGTDINPNLVDAEGVTPLFRAVQRGSQELVQTMLEVLGDLLDFGAKSKVAGVEQGGTVLQAAVSAANVKLVKALINRRGVQVDRRSFDLCLRLVATRPAQCSEIMGLLLSNGGISLAGNGKTSAPTGPSSTLNTAASGLPPANGVVWDDAPPLPPLHQVVCYNNAELVKLLVVRADADVDEKDANGMTPLHHAVERKAYEAAVKLVTLGARVSELSYGANGTTPLIAAVAALDLQMVKELLKSESGLEVNTTDGRGHSALTVALRTLLTPPRANDAQRQRVVDAATEIANRLLRVGADCNQPLLTARQWAAKDLEGCDSVASTGSAPTGEPAGPVLSFAVTEYGMEDDLFTPLLAAISMASGSVVQMLLQEKTVEVNGYQGGPAAIHIALRCALAATNAAARSVTLREEIPAAPPSERSAWELLPFNSIQRRGHVPVATGPLAEARTTAMRILRMLAQEDRVNLLQPNPWLGPGGHKGPSVLMQLVVIGGTEAVELVRDLLAVGRELQINHPDPMTGETVLHVAAAKGDCAMLEVLIQARNIDINALDKKGRSPLASAVANDQVYAIRCLLAHGRFNMHAKAPLDPCICGASDPASSPMALAIAQPSAHALEALLYGTRHADRHFGANSRTESQTDQGSLAGTDVYDVRVMIQSENGSAAPSYDVVTLLSASVDAMGRPPILAAMIACKLEHVRMLVEFGARLDVQGDAPALTSAAVQAVAATPQASGVLATPGGRGPPPATPLPTVAATPAGGEARKVLSTPFSLLCQYVRNLDGRDKARLDQAKSLAVMMAEHPTLDIKDGTELQWAVLSRNVAAVEALAVRAQRAGLINARASVFRGHRCTALELAVQQDLVPIARALLMRGASSDTAMLAQAAKAKKEMYTLLKHPPQVLPVEAAPHEQAPVLPGPPGPARGPPLDDPYDLGKKPDHPISGPIGIRPKDTIPVHLRAPTPEELHEAFRTNLCLAVGAAGGPGGGFFAPGPVADALESECAIAECLLAVDMATVVLHRACLEQMRDSIRKQLPTLKALKDECQRRKDTGRGTVPKDVLPCVEKLGELYIQVHRKAVDWCTTEKASLVKRMLQANEYQEIQQMQMALHTLMLALALAVDGAQMLPESAAELYAADQKQLEEGVKAIIQTDMQSEMRDLHATVLILGEEAQNQAVKMFRSFGLTYHRTIQKWLRETVFPTLVIKHSSLTVVKKVGSGATATVYLVKHNDQLKAFKRFDAMLPGAQEAVSCEGFVLSTLDHPNVLRLHGIVIEREQCGLVVDYHENGSLHQLIQACAAGTQPMSLVKRVALGVQIAKGMAYLHGHSLGSIVHGDLKPSNVLISRDRRAIIDFGLASGMADGWTATQAPTNNPANQQPAGAYDASAVYYQAPEVLQQLLAGKKREASSDVFAFGVLLLELMTLKPVRTGFARDPADYQYKIERGDRPTIPEQLPGPLQFCMGLCWAQNTDHRPSFATVVDLLTHVYTDLVDDVQ